MVVKSGDAGAEALAFLRSEERGRATVLARDAIRDASVKTAPSGEGVRGALADMVRHAPDDATLVRHLLGDVVVVDTLEHALALRGECAATLVTLAGRC